MFKVEQLHLNLFSYLLMNHSFVNILFKNNTIRIYWGKKIKP